MTEVRESIGLARYLPPQSESLVAALSAVGADVRLETVPGAGHIFHGCPDVGAVVRRSVDYLAHALLPERG